MKVLQKKLHNESGQAVFVSLFETQHKQSQTGIPFMSFHGIKDIICNNSFPQPFIIIYKKGTPLVERRTKDIAANTIT